MDCTDAQVRMGESADAAMIREPRSEFVGRRGELDTLATLLDASRLVTLTGVGGAGKTRLAMRAANTHAERTGIACWFIPLDAVQDARQLPLAVARALPLGEQSAREPIEFILDVLGDGPALLVLDNCEHLIDAAAALVNDLLDAMPQLVIVATSRRRLELDGEQTFAVPPLSIDGPAGEPPEAVALLVARARAADASFALDPDDIDAAAELCRALDGLPLAIELAASRLRTLSIADLAGRLSSRFTLLRGASRSAVARQRTLRAVVDWSHELCTPQQRTLWAALSIFTGPFDLAAAVAVAGTREPAVVDALDELITQSVVEADRDIGRFHLLETIREYGRERAEEAGLWPQLLSRHLDHYRRLAAASCHDWYGPGQADTIATQRANRAELQTALATAAERGADAALGLFSNLRYHWGVGGFLPEGRAWATRVLALPDASPQRRVPALITAAWLCLLQGDLAEGHDRLQEAHDLSATSPPLEDAALIDVELRRWEGTHALFSGAPERARSQFEASIRLALAGGMPEEALLAQFQLTTALSHLRQPRASGPGRDALRYAESIGERWMRSLALWSLALAAFVEGDVNGAEDMAREALTTEKGIDDPVGDCLMLELLSWVDAARSPTERSAILLGAAHSRWRRIGSDIAVHGPQMAGHHDRCVEIVVTRLGALAFDRLMAAGGRLAPSEAVSFAVSARRPPTVLSEREMQVAGAIREGLSNRTIADRLVLSVRTIDTHVQRILAKLGFTSRAQIAAWYESTGH